MVLPPFMPRLSAEEMRDRHDKGLLNGVFRIDADVYHAGPGISSTGLKTLLKSPAHFRIPFDATDAMELGTLIHLAILQPHIYDAGIDPFSGASRQSKAWDAHAAAAQAVGKIPILDKEVATIERVRESFAKSRTWSSLSRGAEHEVAAFVQPEGAACQKALTDCISPDGIMSDIKSTSSSLADPQAFWKVIHDFGYHISGAYYLDVWSAALERKLTTFVIVACETKPPYGIRFYPLSERMLEIGRQEYRRALALYETCMDSDTWECYPDQFEDIEFPPYIVERYA